MGKKVDSAQKAITLRTVAEVHARLDLGGQVARAPREVSDLKDRDTHNEQRRNSSKS